MRNRLSVWRTASVLLLGYQALVATATVVFAVWLIVGALACTPAPACGVVGGLVSVLGFVWLGQALVAGAVVAVLFRLTWAWPSRGAAIVNIVLEGIGLFPAIAFLNLLGPFGVPGLERYAFAVAIAAAISIVLLSGLELFASDKRLTSHRLMVVAVLVATPFAGAAVPGLASAYSSAQIGRDGFPVGPVTAQFVEVHGSKLRLLYPGSVLKGTTVMGESKTFNRYRLASWEETLGKNGPSADVQAWYERSLADGGWQETACQPGFQHAVDMVFVRGSRESLVVLVTGDGAGGIVIRYQITPSAEPLKGHPAANNINCGSHP